MIPIRFRRRRWALHLPAALALSAALLVSCGDDADAPQPIAEAPQPAFTLQLLHLSDMDGSDATALASVANMSAQIERLKASYPAATLLLSSGDNYIPGPRFNAANDPALSAPSLLGKAEVGRADIAFLNAMGVQASALGNHELDLNTRQFRDIIAVDGAWAGAAFPYLAYNVDFAADPSTAPLVAPNGQDVAGLRNKVTGWATVTVGGQRIGLIGASSPTFTTITSTGSLGFSPAQTGGGNFDVDALATVIQRGVDEIKSAGIDKIILLSHMQQIAVEKSLAARLRDVDIVIAGGSNTLLADGDDALRAGDTAADTYPLRLAGADGRPVVIVNTDADYKYLGRLVAPFDASGVLIPSRLDATLNGAVATRQDSDAAGTTAPLPAVVAIRDAINGVLQAKDGTAFGQTAVFLDGRRASVRNEETNFGNLSADANLWYANQAGQAATISLKNGGGIRSEIGVVVVPAGSASPSDYQLLPPQANPATGRAANTVSQLAIETALKFNNRLWVFDVTATELKQLLEHGVAALGSQGRFPQVGGMAFSYDPDGTAQVTTAGTITVAGTRIRSLKVGADTVVQTGALVGDPNRSFRMVTLNFLATGGDGYPFPALLANLVKLEEAGLPAGSASFAAAGSEQDAFAEYLLATHPDAGTAFAVADTPASADARVQNVRLRTDTVLLP